MKKFILESLKYICNSKLIVNNGFVIKICVLCSNNIQNTSF